MTRPRKGAPFEVPDIPKEQQSEMMHRFREYVDEMERNRTPRDHAKIKRILEHLRRKERQHEYSYES